MIPPKPGGKRGKLAKSAAHNLLERMQTHEVSVLLFAKEGDIADHFESEPYKTFEIPCGKDGLWTLDQLRRSGHRAAEQAMTCIEEMVKIARKPAKRKP